MDAHPLGQSVADLLRRVAAEVVMPRFRALDASEVEEKTPGELVTIADREAEARISEGLAALLPEARVIGEEAVAADPSLLDGIGHGLAWIVDPIDGTANFAAGRPPFALMVALIEDGATQAGWILDPVNDRLHQATRGGGTFINGVRVHARPSGAALPQGALSVRYFPEGMREQFVARMQGRIADVAIPHCAGEQYPRLISGENDMALFWRTLPWDHAAGALIVQEAGGCVRRFDGRDYRVDQEGNGLLAAASPKLWDEAAAVLLG